MEASTFYLQCGAVECIRSVSDVSLCVGACRVWQSVATRLCIPRQDAVAQSRRSFSFSSGLFQTEKQYDCCLLLALFGIFTRLESHTTWKPFLTFFPLLTQTTIFYSSQLLSFCVLAALNKLCILFATECAIDHCNHEYYITTIESNRIESNCAVSTRGANPP